MLNFLNSLKQRILLAYEMSNGIENTWEAINLLSDFFWGPNLKEIYKSFPSFV